MQACPPEELDLLLWTQQEMYIENAYPLLFQLTTLMKDTILADEYRRKIEELKIPPADPAQTCSLSQFDDSYMDIMDTSMDICMETYHPYGVEFKGSQLRFFKGDYE